MGITHVHGQFLLLFFYVIFLIIFPLSSSLTESEALLKLKQSFTNANALDSWQPGSEPCAGNTHWIGVVCEHGAIFGLRLGHMALSGKIDMDALASLSGIRSVALTGNSFSGPIPDFYRIGHLKGLYISENQFSGEIPSDYFSKMHGLKKVWMSKNNFSGPIPSSLAWLSQLMELHIENNGFSGTIPPLNQTSLVAINLSNNNLEGEIPSSMSEKFGPKPFEGNEGLCGGSTGRACESTTPPTPTPISAPSPPVDVPAEKKRSSSNGLKIAMWFLVAFAAVLVLMVVAIFLMRRRNQMTSEDVPQKENLDDNPVVGSNSESVRIKDMDSSKKGFGSGHRTGSSKRGSIKRGNDLVMLNDEKGEFGLGDLMRASAEVLGTGVTGSSYKAMMDNGVTVVVKRMKEMGKMGRDKFDMEMRRFGSLKHKNVLTPLGYHYRKDEKLLVYEYQHKGSLMYLLHGDRGMSHNELNWPVRFKIIQGIASGLGYLHTELSSYALPHGDLKSSNILLTPDHEPLLVDYGFYSLITSQAMQALMACKAPEAMQQQPVSPKCDVFCLGIVILEILTGKFPSQYLNNAQGGTDLVQWVKSAFDEGREAELLDPDIASATNYLNDMQQLLRIGAACTESNPDQRLDLGEVVRRIEAIQSNKESTTIHILPSTLREGYGDQGSPSAAEPAPGLVNRNAHSWRKHDGDRDQSVIEMS